MTMKYGLEKEFFIVKKGTRQLVVVPDGMPADECGWLVEARGKPADNITDAVFLLEAEIYKIGKQATKLGYDLYDWPIAKLPRDVAYAASRKYSKGMSHYENMYGHKYHRNKRDEVTAGVHLSITDSMETEVIGVDKVSIKRFTLNRMFDFIKYVRVLDDAFKVEIKKSKREPGFYELKGDGRIEYRSLPANVDIYKLIEVVESVSYGECDIEDGG